MNKIIPAILTTNFLDINLKTKQVESLVSLVQIDICDGHFTSDSTWPYDKGVFPEIKDDFEILGWEKLNFEFDLMMENPLSQIENIKNLGGNHVVLHLDSMADSDFLTTALEFQKFDMQIGVGVRNDLDLERVVKIVESLIENYITPYIQVMGIEKIGKQKQPFDDRTLETVAKLKSVFPDLVFQVDGGVNENTIPLLKEAGVNNFVVGSALFEAGIPTRDQYFLLKKLI